MMSTTTLAPRDGRATPETLPGMKYCKHCLTHKPLDDFAHRHRGGEGSRRPECRSCGAIYQKKWKASGQRIVNRRKIASHLDIDLDMVTKGRTEPWQIPASDCEVQLTIILACWLSCVEVGTDAIRRMMASLVDATYLPGSVSREERVRLRQAVQSYRSGAAFLDFVERTLRGVVGSGE